MTVSHPAHRVAMLCVHTSPLAQPGTGDAGGMNVYVVELARAMAAQGTEVEIFTRRTTANQPDVVEVDDGVLVRHVTAGPYEGLDKNDLPGQLCYFTQGVLRTEAARQPGWYDIVHSHYWLSGQAGWLAADRWNVPLVHTMHTMARVKNAQLAPGTPPNLVHASSVRNRWWSSQRRLSLIRTKRHTSYTRCMQLILKKFTWSRPEWTLLRSLRLSMTTSGRRRESRWGLPPRAMSSCSRDVSSRSRVLMCWSTRWRFFVLNSLTAPCRPSSSLGAPQVVLLR